MAEERLGRMAEQFAHRRRRPHDTALGIGAVISVLHVVEDAPQFALGLGHGALRLDDRRQVRRKTEGPDQFAMRVAMRRGVDQDRKSAAILAQAHELVATVFRRRDPLDLLGQRRPARLGNEIEGRSAKQFLARIAEQLAKTVIHLDKAVPSIDQEESIDRAVDDMAIKMCAFLHCVRDGADDRHAHRRRNGGICAGFLFHGGMAGFFRIIAQAHSEYLN